MPKTTKAAKPSILCPYCDERFHVESDVWRHAEQKHPKEHRGPSIPKACAACHKLLDANPSLNLEVSHKDETRYLHKACKPSWIYM